MWCPKSWCVELVTVSVTLPNGSEGIETNPLFFRRSLTMYLEVETDSAIYETEFKYFQVEITGKCNMACIHCRATIQEGLDMPLDLLSTITRFGRRYLSDQGEMVISGGEPIVHRKFKDVLKVVYDEGIQAISVTSNGLLFKESIAQEFGNLMDKGVKVFVGFSLDSSSSERHNEFRRNQNAFSGVERAIRVAKDYGIPFALRSTVFSVEDVPGIIQFAEENRCECVAFSDVHPFGEALKHPEYIMRKSEKMDFHRQIHRIRSHVLIGMNDPLYGVDAHCTGRGGCGAGVLTFNANVNGDITPCAFLPQVVTNARGKDVPTIVREYTQSEVIHNLVEMNYSGKCGTCQNKSVCNGCRARAFASTGNYLGEDPHCYY